MNFSEHLSYFEATNSDSAKKYGIKNEPDEAQMVNIERLARNVFEPLRIWANEPIRVNSLFRSVELNAKIGGAKNSQHTCINGSAMDISAMGHKTNADLFNYIKDNLEFDQLIWEFGTKLQPDWVHVSFKLNDNRKEVLKGLKSNGKVIYQKYE